MEQRPLEFYKIARNLNINILVIELMVYLVVFVEIIHSNLLKLRDICLILQHGEIVHFYTSIGPYYNTDNIIFFLNLSTV